MKLTKQQLKDVKLLDKCIQHWEDMHGNAAVSLKKGVVPNAEFCALCLEYTALRKDFDDPQGDCTGCPIAERSGMISCRAADNPFETAELWFYRSARGKVKSVHDQWHTTSQNMIDYLVATKEWVISQSQ